VEVSALRHVGREGLRGPTPLLRLQSDERLVALTRRGNQGAYEALVGRYQARLLSFCRHMLGSREDAEDVLQEVFAAAFNAMTADERPINVRPWLYRIARNRSLNHLRRTQAIGVDSMDVHLAEHGASTADKVHKREEFRLLMGDVHRLPESQRTALLLREIDALSYEQISEAMETTIPSVKSLLVRARVSLAEAAEARHLSCEEVREELGEVAEGLRRMSPPVRRHVRTCGRCAGFRKQLKETNKALAVMLPIGPLLVLKKLVLANLGTTASAGGSAAAAASASAGTGAGGALSASAGAIGAKAAAGLAAAAIVTAGAVEVDHATQGRATPTRRAVAAAPVATTPAAPRVVARRPQPSTVAPAAPRRRATRAAAAHTSRAPHPDAAVKAKASAEAPGTTARAATPASTPPQPAPVPDQGSATASLPPQPPAADEAPDPTPPVTTIPVTTTPATAATPATTTAPAATTPTPPAADPAPDPVPPVTTTPPADPTPAPAPPADAAPPPPPAP
jgi:RNA polymerase sigma factor (sigma-70 family)